MATAMMLVMTRMLGIDVRVARPRLVTGAAPGAFPGYGASTRWSEITGFPVRHRH